MDTVVIFFATCNFADAWVSAPGAHCGFFASGSRASPAGEFTVFHLCLYRRCLPPQLNVCFSNSKHDFVTLAKYLSVTVVPPPKTLFTGFSQCVAFTHPPPDIYSSTELALICLLVGCVSTSSVDSSIDSHPIHHFNLAKRQCHSTSFWLLFFLFCLHHNPNLDEDLIAVVDIFKFILMVSVAYTLLPSGIGSHTRATYRIHAQIFQRVYSGISRIPCWYRWCFSSISWSQQWWSHHETQAHHEHFTRKWWGGWLIFFFFEADGKCGDD